jgi:AraC-like DNA-binding protein
MAGVKMRTIAKMPAAASLPGSVSVQILENLFDQVPDVAFFVKDTQGRYAAVNDSLVARHGLREKSQVLGKRPRDICPGDFGGIPSRQDADVLRSGEPLVDHLELHWYAPHEPGWCLTSKLPIRDGAGKVVGLIGISRDVRAPVPMHEIPQELADALNYFETHLAEVMTPAALARRAKMPAHRLARLMKRFFGITPSQYIAKARMTAASRLLQQAGKSVADVALCCGFYDHSAFARMFRKLTGQTPSQFRAIKTASREGE